jgi:hypothetical protein
MQMNTLTMLLQDPLDPYRDTAELSGQYFKPTLVDSTSEKCSLLQRSQPIYKDVSGDNRIAKSEKSSECTDMAASRLHILCALLLVGKQTNPTLVLVVVS